MCMAPEIARLALPVSTDPVKPGDALGVGVGLALELPVAPEVPRGDG